MGTDSYQEWLASWHPRPIEERTFAPARVAPWICPECASPATIGVRVGDLVNVRCEAHGTWYAMAPFSFTRQELLVTAPRPPKMNPEARLWFLHTAAKVMLDAAPGSFLVIELQGHPCEYAIIDRSPGRELGLQIGSRQWDCPHCGNQPISEDAADRLSSLGFAPPGPHLNAWRKNLPAASRDFAILLERSFQAAYAPPLDFEVALYASRLEAYKRLVSMLSWKTAEASERLARGGRSEQSASATTLPPGQIEAPQTAHGGCAGRPRPNGEAQTRREHSRLIGRYHPACRELSTGEGTVETRELSSPPSRAKAIPPL